MDKIQDKISNLQKLKTEVHEKYLGYGLIVCPVINERVMFNNQGWKHISFDGKGHRRNSKSIYMRLKLVIFAPEVIQQASTVIKDEIRTLQINNVDRKVRFIELALSIKNSRSHVTVILRRIEEGTLHYYSVRRTKNKVKRLLLKQKSP